jgi:hypothetical protein
MAPSIKPIEMPFPHLVSHATYNFDIIVRAPVWSASSAFSFKSCPEIAIGDIEEKTFINCAKEYLGADPTISLLSLPFLSYYRLNLLSYYWLYCMTHCWPHCLATDPTDLTILPRNVPTVFLLTDLTVLLLTDPTVFTADPTILLLTLDRRIVFWTRHVSSRTAWDFCAVHVF